MQRDGIRRPVALAALLAVLAVAAPAAGEEMARGFATLVGKVLDPGGNPLPGASVTLVGTNLIATSDVTGSYRLAPVPAGRHEVRVAYLGTPDSVRNISITKAQTLSLDLTFDAFSEELTVLASPLLTGQAKALNQQRNAIHVLNVISADQIGRFPDPNAAEATQRAPAITLLRDQGEGRFVLVRGTEARLNSMMINGERVPSPDGDGRDVALDVIPADLLEAIEVSKALTPDMDADAIGGTVNLVTKRAPENTRLATTLAGGYNELVEDDIEAANLTFGGRLGGQDRLGVLVSGSGLETRRGSDNFEAEYDDGFLDQLELRDYTIERQRCGGAGALDYSASDRRQHSLQMIWNEFNDQELRRRKRQRVGDEEIERELKDRFEAQRIISGRFGSSHLVTSSLLVDYHLGWSLAREDEPRRLDSVFLQEGVEFAPNVSPSSIDPNNLRANPANESLDEFVLDEVVREDNRTEEEDRVLALDVTVPFYRHAGFSGMWKTGGKLRYKHKERDSNALELDVEDLPLLGLVDDWRSETPFFGGRYDVGRFPSPLALRQLSAGLDSERDLESDLEDYQADEDTTSLYGQVEIQRGDLTVLGGVRYESTETSYTAFQLIDGEDVLVPVMDSDSYGELLPMVHLRRRLNDASVLRGALTRTLSRPNFADLAPFLFEEDEERERGNPELDLTTAWNLDLFYERYFTPVGVLSAGVFYKRLDDNIFTFTFEELTNGTVFDVTQPRNGDSADLAGLEIAFQNRLDKLPAPFDGLGVYFNYTYTDSEVNFPSRLASRLQGQAEHLGNLALSFEKGGFSSRLSLNYHGDYLLLIGEEPAEDVFVDDHAQVDLWANYRLTRRLGVFLQLINLGDEPFRVYEGTADRPLQEEVYSWWGTLGLKWDF